jgi:RNA polymerase sigma-70 factor, ECF subfamily
MNDIANIHSQFGEYLFNFIRKKVGSGEIAEDIYQDVLVKILNKPDQLNIRKSLKSWLFTIAKNQIIDHYRKQKSLSDIETLQIDFKDQTGTNGYEDLEGCIHSFISQLPDDYRQIIILSEIEGKSQKELSESLGINYVTVRSKVQRGREKIRKLIYDACVIDQNIRGGFVDCTPKGQQVNCGSVDNTCGCGG